MIAAAVKTPLQSVAASAFATNELVLGLPLHRLFADEASFTIEAGMTAPSAEGFSGIGNRGLELRTTLGVTAVMPDFDSELGHSYTSDPPFSGSISSRKQNFLWSWQGWLLE